MIPRWPFFLLLCTSLSPLFCQTAPSAAESWLTETDVAIPMRDGVLLRADILRPQSGGRSPVLVYRTPYGKESALKDYTTFRHAAERGYAVVVQDVRGRYASDGEFRPYQNEGRDGYDTIEWAAKQPWSNGSVGTFGLSYPGAVQWLAAVENPPHLKAMVPAMTFSTPQNFFYAGGVWDMSWIDWIWENIAFDSRAKKNLPGPRTEQESASTWASESSRMQNTLPLRALPDLKDVASYYYDWLSHPPDDPWWDWCELRDKYARVHAAVLNFSGWYDDNYGPEGATTNFNGLMRTRSGEEDPRNALLLGPWVHGVASTAKTKSGEREFSPEAAIDYDEAVLRWMDHYLRGRDNGVGREKRVRYFVMGDNRWQEANSWPPTARPLTFYLDSPAKDEAIGRLSPRVPRPIETPSSFVSDPLKPVLNSYLSSGGHDYRALVTRSDVLTFDSAPLARDMEVTGPIHAQVFLACDCLDTDLWVRLQDVAPDGAAINVMGPGLDVIRASYRDLKRGRQLLTPQKPYELHLDNLITSNVFLRGHRLRVQISTSFFPNFSRNLHTGELETTSATTKPAKITIFHDARRPSKIILPLVTR
jgi:uncharacterized protein